MTLDPTRPWLGHYRATLQLEHATVLDAFRAAVGTAPDAPAVKYFDAVMTLRQLDEDSDALASALSVMGFDRGDRLALYLQNVPQFVIGVLAAWKAGGVAVPVNPMNRARELRYVLNDSGARGVLCLESLHGEVAKAGFSGFTITTSELAYQTRFDQRLFMSQRREPVPDTPDMEELVQQHRHALRVDVEPTDIAFITYTSGTTGEPKGAINTHANVAFSAQAYRSWAGLTPSDVILGAAPLFHITGLVAHVALSLLVPSPLVLSYRFNAEVTRDAIKEHAPTFTVAAITAFIALMNLADTHDTDLASLSKVYSGGAPIAPAVAAEYERRFGHRIHNIYGLTETTSPTHAVPFGADAPVDDASGALSVGVPIFDTVARVVDDDGIELPPGQIGEFELEGPQVVPGYWNKPIETQRCFPKGRLLSGDVGFMNDDGWFFVVDRKKDMINAAGYKVWPREVEDVLYEHPAVREAAVVGVPDAYRGETVKAFVSLKRHASVDVAALQRFCKERMAAYKYPRQIEVVDDLPKTITGKILRRELRQAGQETAGFAGSDDIGPTGPPSEDRRRPTERPR